MAQTIQPGIAAVKEKRAASSFLFPWTAANRLGQVANGTVEIDVVPTGTTITQTPATLTSAQVNANPPPNGVASSVYTPNSGPTLFGLTPGQLFSETTQGLTTGTKALINATADTLVSTVTLGQIQIDPVWAVNSNDIGYNTAYAFTRAGTQILAGVATGGLAGAGGAVGTVAQGYMFLSNAQGAINGVANIAENGLTLQNGFQVATSLLNVGNQAIPGCNALSKTTNLVGLAGNVSGATVSATDIILNGANGDNTTQLLSNVTGAVVNVNNLNSCFAAGTPLLTPTGSRLIEEFRVGDLILSRSEDDAGAVPEGRAVEEVFAKTGKILELQVNGKVIKTTAEHPFYVREKGWIAAREMRTGDLIASDRGQWFGVQAIADTGEYATLYNLRVAIYHTYFVGAADWGFSLWAHNGGPNCGGSQQGETPASLAAAAALAEANAVQASGKTGAAAGLAIPGVGVFTGVSTKAGGGALNTLPTQVQEAYGFVPPNLQSAVHGKCAEGRAIAAAVAAGADPNGGTMVVIRAGGPNHGKPIAICSSCGIVLQLFGINSGAK